MKKIHLLILSIIILNFSCSDNFLKEDLVSTLTSDYYNTPQGVSDLLNASYTGLRWRFTGEHGYCLTNYGVDEMTVGNGTDMIEYNDYNSSLMPSEQGKRSDAFWGVTIAWRDIWYSINSCNIGIEKVHTVNGTPLQTEALRKNAEAQFRFLRAFYYFDLVQQFGSIPLVVKSTNASIVTEYPKTPVKNIYDTIIADFKAAIPYLNDVESQAGRVTRGAACHFLAKAYLTKASEVNRSWNSNYSNDLDSAIRYAELVIEKKSVYSLEPDFAKLFTYTKPNDANETSKEIILAAQFSDNMLAIGNGNKMHLYSLSWYEDIGGLKRDIAHGRPWRRLCPTDYAYDVFDRKNDSRFYKSFKFSYLANREDNIPTYPNGTKKFALGDTALIYIVNSMSNPIDSSTIASWRYRAFVRYVKGVNGDIKKMMPDNIKNHFACISKYIDPTRPTVAQEQGYRDGILARLAETYLIAAEAYGRKGNYDKAMEYINVLRTRAAYKSGEKRHPVYYMVVSSDASNPETTNDLLLKSSGELTTVSADPVQAKYFPPSANTSEKIFICHILNERARELMCELVRWQDLARTSTLIERATLLNGSAKPIAGKHELRPIPQTFIDGLQKDGRPLTQEEKVAYQNSGY